MNITARILLGYLAIAGLAMWFVVNTFSEEVKPGVRQAMEETLVDTSQVLAMLARDEVRGGTIDSGRFRQAMEAVVDARFEANIWGVTKTSVDYRVLITDAKGKVIFDSHRVALGTDMSRWNDVARTLKGGYGARSTRADPSDPSSSVMHVAAPIMDQGKLIGVLSVAKPTRSVLPYADRSRRRVLQAGLVLLALSLVIGLIFAGWIRGSIQQLLGYAAAVTAGRTTEPPSLSSPELSTLSDALGQMRERLEGKQYVERYVHSMTHEMKSPLTAIRGAAELLREELPASERAKFIEHIELQSGRLQALVDRALSLASVESKRRLEEDQPIMGHLLLSEVVDDLGPKATEAGVTLTLETDGEADLRGDGLLLRQAIGNLVDNAIDFSPRGALIRLRATTQPELWQVEVIDQGVGIPEFARGRVFERFFSLPRPTSGAKSTGLGLPFVRQVAKLHGGDVALTAGVDGGVIARLTLRRASP